MIAGELKVRYVLEGSVRRAGSSVRITVQLIEAATDTHLWAERYTGVLDDVFDLQERLARSIVQALRVALTPDEERRLAKRQIQDARAFDLYLRARQAMHELTQTGLERALTLLSEALAITGPNALLFGTQGEVCFWLRDLCIRPDQRTIEEAAAHIHEALTMDPGSFSALLVRCMIAWRQGDMRRAILDARRAAELGGGGDALTMLTFACGEAGLMTEAHRAAGEAVAVDPGNWFSRFAQGVATLLDGDLRAAVEAFRRLVEMTGGIPVSHLWHGVALAYSGRVDEASTSFAQVQRAQESAIASMGRLHNAALRKDPEEFAVVMAGSPLAELARADKEFSWWLADLHARMGDHEAALCWLEQAVQLGFYNQRFWSEVDPFLAPLRSYPRFEELMHLARVRQDELRLALDDAA